jgi:hypothetical protein
MRKYYKIGSLSLSVNAIVVLVLGITMLGLGLAFTKGMFGKLQGKLEIPPPNIPATSSEPIVLPSDEISIGRKEAIIPINVYNSLTTGTISLDTNTTAPLDCNITMQAVSQKVPEDEFRTFQVVTTPGDTQQTCVFTIKALKGAEKVASKQITIKAG